MGIVDRCSCVRGSLAATQFVTDARAFQATVYLSDPATPADASQFYDALGNFAAFAKAIMADTIANRPGSLKDCSHLGVTQGVSAHSAGPPRYNRQGASRNHPRGFGAIQEALGARLPRGSSRTCVLGQMAPAKHDGDLDCL